MATTKTTSGKGSIRPADAVSAPKRLRTRAYHLDGLRTAYEKSAVLHRWRVGNPMHGQGNAENPRLAFIVLSPTAHDASSGKQFLSGPESVVFNDMLRCVDMLRSDVYITAICKWPTPCQRITESKFALDKAFEFIREEVKIVNPKNVVLLGRQPSELFLPGVDLMNEHGRVSVGNGRNYVPMFNPQTALVNNNMAKSLLEDMTSLNHLL